MEAQSPKSLLRAFTTWNTWGVPFASPYLFHRFGKWRAFHDRQLLTFLGEHAPDAIPGGDLIVCCFQEVWSFPKGPLMECTARMDPRKVWDAAQKLFEKREPDAPRIEYTAVVGNRGMSLAWNSLVDSGLCIFSTRTPAEKGFRAYRNYPDGLHEERLANKGVLWAFWVDDSQGLLVLNTHLSTRSAVKLRQLGELAGLFTELKSKFLSFATVLEVYVCGDFNLDPQRDPGFKSWCEELGFERITTGKPTNGWLSVALDHIFTWRSDSRKISHVVSDPVRPWVEKCQFGTCHCERDDISDHCWQCMVVRK